MFDVLRDLFKGKKESSVEDNLSYYVNFSNIIISAGLFGAILYNKLELKDYFGEDDIPYSEYLSSAFIDKSLQFILDKWILIIFACAILLWFVAYKKAVENEMKIMVKMYSRINPPHDWEKFIGKKWIPVLSIGLTVAFLGLAWSIDNIELFCIIMLLLNVQDAYGNSIVSGNMLRHFTDKRYEPDESDRHAQFIKARREVALEYWVWRPHLARIGFMMIGTILAFISSNSDSIIGVTVGGSLPYFIIIIIIVANESVLSIWRIDRNRKLEKIDYSQEESERMAAL